MNALRIPFRYKAQVLKVRHRGSDRRPREMTSMQRTDMILRMQPRSARLMPKEGTTIPSRHSVPMNRIPCDDDDQRLLLRTPL